MKYLIPLLLLSQPVEASISKTIHKGKCSVIDNIRFKNSKPVTILTEDVIDDLPHYGVRTLYFECVVK